MWRVGISGGLLLTDAVAQYGQLWHQPSGVSAGLLLLAGAGLLWSVHHFSSEIFRALTDHDESFSV